MTARTARIVILVIAMAAWMSSQAQSSPRPAEPAAAAIKLSLRVGPPTLPFTVRGRGFGATEVVDVTFDLTPIGSATTNGAGSFSKGVTVPVDATPGAHRVTATGETSHLTASSGFTVRTNWSKFHFDAANTGFNPFENVLDPSNVSGLAEQWSVRTATGAAPDPAISGGIVYVAPADGIVRALDPANGSLIWSHDTGGTMVGYAPAVFGGSVYVTNDAGDTVALTTGTGQLIWSVDLGSSALGNSVAGGMVYVSAAIGGCRKAFGLDATTGSIVWSQENCALGAQAPVSGGLIHFGTVSPCSVTTFDAVTGTFVWRSDLCGEESVNQQAGAVSGGTLFGQFDGTLNALAASDGHLQWRAGSPLGVIGDGAPAVANGVVYLAIPSMLTAYDQATGSEVWSQPLEGSHSSPAVANGVVYVGTDGGTLRAYDALTGSLLWESADVGDQVSSPAVSDGVVYVGTLDGRIHAFGLP